MASRTSPQVESKKPLWQHPLLGEVGGPGFKAAEEARRAHSWAKRARLVTAAKQREKEAYKVYRDLREWEPHRSISLQKAETKWEEAQANFYAVLKNIYSPDFYETWASLSENQPTDLTPVLTFLEADPYFFGSGYTKESLLVLLKRYDFTPTQAEQMRELVLTAVTRPAWRREFRYYGRLARKVDSPAFRAALTEIMTNGEYRERKKAAWVLEALNS
jgi:hypothetical protein